MKKITVLFNEVEENTLESEKDTQESADWVKKILDKLGYETELTGVKKESVGKVGNIFSDLVFNLIEWTGEETKYALRAIEMLNQMRIPYTGSDLFGYKLSTEKIIMKKKMAENRILTPEFQVFSTGEEKTLPLPYPVIIKPAREHCGVGVDQKSVVEDEGELKKYIKIKIKELNQPMMAEEFIEGREFHVTVLETRGKPWVLPPAEVVFENHPGFRHVLTYAGKWRNSTEEYKYSTMRKADIGNKLKERIEKIAQEAYEKLGGRDYPRLDFRYDGKRLYVLEINNNPGIDYAADSGIGVSARAAGLSEEGLIDHVVKNAWWRFVNCKKNNFLNTI